jgi:hypothetical protein
MFDLVKSASDDQMALGISFVTLAASAFFLFVCFHLGPAGAKLREEKRRRLLIDQMAREMTESKTTTRERAA